MSKHGRVQVVAVGLKALFVALVLAGGVAAVAPTDPLPTIDDILGVWETKWSETATDVNTGAKSSGKGEATITITYVGPSEVNLHWQEGGASHDDLAWYCDGGVLWGSSSDGGYLSNWAYTFHAQVKGKVPGLKMSGLYMAYAPQVYDGKFSGKRVSP